MDINRASMETLFCGFGMQFSNGLGMAPDQWKQFSTVIPSATAKNIYPFLEQIGGMREWVGDRFVKNLSSKKLEVANRDFEETISVRRNDIEDDQYGVYATLVAQMGLNAGKLWQELAAQAMTGSSNWLDGSPFFGTTRKYDGVNAVANTVGTALTEAAFNTAYQAMMEYKGHSGKPLGVVPNLLVVGPKLRATAWNIVKNDFTYTAADKVQTRNINKDICDLMVMPELSGAYDDYWFLMDARNVLKPVVVQQRKLPVLTRLDREEDESVFMRREFVYGADARGEAFLSFPHLVYRGGTAV